MLTGNLCQGSVFKNNGRDNFSVIRINDLGHRMANGQSCIFHFQYMGGLCRIQLWNQFSKALHLISVVMVFE